MDRDEMEIAADGSRIQRACDACRSRKIRCDRGSPCSNCRASKLTCATTAPAQKPQRQRVHISDEYEKKIDRIEDRLAGIENVLESLAAKLGNLDLHREASEQLSQPKHRSLAARSPLSVSDVNSAHTPATFEGETTINKQSEIARELLEKAVGSTPSMGQNVEVKAALTSLQDLVTRQGQYTNTLASTSNPFFNRVLVDIDPAKLERPPWDVVLEVIEMASTYPTMSFAVIFPFLNMKNMRDVFKDVFHSPSECSVGRRLLVYGVLENLFTEFACYPVKHGRMANYRTYARTCRTQVEVAMSQLELYLAPTYENILALLLAAAFAMERCKPSLCWVLVSNAAGLSQHLGYHRIQTMKDDTEEDRTAKIYLFWHIYTLDKTLSLRLGRASSIQDWDMSLPYPVPTSDAECHSPMSSAQGTKILLFWIKVSQVSGKVYEQLFSAAAFLKPAEERAQIAAQLVEELNESWVERGDSSFMDFGVFADFPSESVSSGTHRSSPAGPNVLETSSKRQRAAAHFPAAPKKPLDSSPSSKEHLLTIGGDEYFGKTGDIFYYSDVVIHYSTCALIQRAVSVNNASFSQECLSSSRAALFAHQRCSEQFNVEGYEDLWSGYIHWAVLSAPFTPFIVIFCNVLLHRDPSDFHVLSGFVASLESTRTISEGANKLYKMCHLFLQVAKLYVEAKTSESAVPMTPAARTPHSQHHSFFHPDGRSPAAGHPFDSPSSTMAQFDPYLSALGLMPNTLWPMPHNQQQQYPNMDASSAAAGTTASPVGGPDGFAPAAPGAGFDPGTGGMMLGGALPVGMQSDNTVQNWYSGSRYLMNLMEDDIQMPDFNL